MSVKHQEIMPNIIVQNQIAPKYHKPDRSSPPLPPSSSIPHPSEDYDDEGTKIITVRRKEGGYVHRLSRFLSTGHIFNFMDQFFINEETIRNPQNDESIVKTLFYMRTITRLQTTDRCVKMWLKSNGSPSNVPYLIERFNSFGDDYFHKIADTLRQMYSFYINSPASTSPTRTHLTREAAIQSFLESIQGKPYFLKIIPDEYHFSNEMIQLLGGTVDAFTRECVKYKMMMEDFFTSENYRMILEHNIAFQSYYINYLKGLVTMEDVLNASKLRFISNFRGKNQKVIKVQVNAFMPLPFLFCMVIERIISQQPLLGKKKNLSGGYKSQLDKLLMKDKEDVLAKICAPSKGSGVQKGAIHCGYALKPRRRRRKSECDYDY